MENMEEPFGVIAERRLILSDINKNIREEVRICIGTPYWIEEGIEAACPVAVYGLIGRARDIVGIDPLNALELASSFVNSLLENLPPGKELYWMDGEQYEKP
jgi:hypothetical protein